MLCEDLNYAHRKIASKLASKIYYHLEEFDSAMNYALDAEELLNLDDREPFMDTIINKCIEKYSKHRQLIYNGQDSFINPKLENIVQQVFLKSFESREFKMILGIALDCRRVDIISEIFKRCEGSSEILHYGFDLVKKSSAQRKFRKEVLEIISKCLEGRSRTPSDSLCLSECFYLLGQPTSFSTLVTSLLHVDSSSNKSILTGFQICSDVALTQNKEFCSNVLKGVTKYEIADGLKGKVAELLNGKFSTDLNQKFLRLKNSSDPLVLKNVTSKVDSNNSVSHEATVVTHGFLESGTWNDKFFRDEFDWIKKATHWSKFTAISSLGAIHRGNHKNSQELLKPYLPQSSGPNPNFYSHGGAFYALGLIHMGTQDQAIIDQILNAIKDPSHSQNETLIHGACLGLGLVCLGSQNETIFEELKFILSSDSAIMGEAAGISIGLLMAGSGNGEVLEELLEIAHETQHEKIVRSISISCAMIYLGKEEDADTLIDQLTSDKDAIIRYGAAYTIGLAYIGTGNNNALQKLLSMASSDVSDDVRRAATTNLGFLLVNNLDIIIRLGQLLSLSYNPHVRYGIAMALGIASAGKPSSQVLSLLEPTMSDSIDFVRQAGFISMSMVLQQVNKGVDSRVEKLKSEASGLYLKKHGDLLAKYGALLSVGIAEAGGRNSIMSLLTPQGTPIIQAAVGVAVFLQFWYWFPFAHFLNLSFSVSGVFGVNQDLKVPTSIEINCTSTKSNYDYPERLKEEVKDKVKETKTSTLSTTLRLKGKKKTAADQKAKVEGKSMDIETPLKPETEEIEKVKEDPSFISSNPTRVLPKQTKHISFAEGRYKPLFENRKQGFIFVYDAAEGQSENYFGIEIAATLPKIVEEEDGQIHPPDTFMFDEGAQ